MIFVYIQCVYIHISIVHYSKRSLQVAEHVGQKNVKR